MVIEVINNKTSYEAMKFAYSDAETHYQQVIQKVLENRKNVSKESKEILNNELKGLRIKTPGFRNAVRMPTKKLLPLMQLIADKTPNFIVGVLSIWIETEAALRVALLAHMTTEKLPILPNLQQLFDEEGKARVCSLKMASQHQSNFRLKYPEFNISDVSLMYICLSGLIPVDDLILEQAKTTKITEQLIWDDMKTSISDWHFESSHWQVFPQFIDQLKRLTQYKRQESKKSSLIDALVQFHMQDHDKLVFFELTDSLNWHSQVIQLNQADAVANKIIQLQVNLDEYLEAENQTPSSLQEEKEIHEQVDYLFAEITSATEDLREIFSNTKTLDSPIDLQEDILGQTPFYGWLSKLMDLSADDKIWEVASEAIESIQSIADKILNTAKSLEILEKTLNTLKEQQDILSFFNIQISHWSAQAFDYQQISEINDDLTTLSETILEYRQVRDEKPANFKATRSRRDAMKTLSNNVMRLVKVINAGLNDTPQHTTLTVAEQSETSHIEESEISEEKILPEVIENEEIISPIEAISTDNEEADIDFETDQQLALEQIQDPLISSEEAEKTPFVETSFKNLDTIVQQLSHHILSQAEISSERVQELAWHLIQQHRLSTAYQLLTFYETETEDYTQPLQSWILKSIVLGRHIRFSTGEIASQLKQSFAPFLSSNFKALDNQNPNDLGIILLMVAASLRPALLSPQTYAGDVLRSLKMPSGLSSAVYTYQQRITTFAHEFRPLDMFSLNRVKDEASWEYEVQILQSEVQDWLESSKDFSFSFQPSFIVWQQWHTSGGYFSRLMTPILNKDETSTTWLEKEIKQHLSNDDLLRAIILRDYNTAISDKGRYRVNSLEPRALGTICTRMRTVTEFVTRWLELVDAKPGVSKKYDQQRAEDLRRDILKVHDQVVDTLNQFVRHHDNIKIISAMDILLTSIHDIYDLFNPETAFPNKSIEIKYLLNDDMICIPSIQHGDDWLPQKGKSAQIFSEFLQYLTQPKPDWFDLYSLYTNNWNHKATGEILDYFQSPLSPFPKGIDNEIFEQRLQHIEDCKNTIKRRIDEVNAQIEKAVRDGIISEEERQQYISVVVTIENTIEQDLDFYRMRSELSNVLTNLDEARKEKEDEIRTRLDKISISNEDDQQLLEQAFAAGDFVTVNEYMEMLNNGEQLSATSTRPNLFINYFPKISERIERYLEQGLTPRDVINNVKTKRNIAGIDLKNVPGAQIDEATEMMKAWYRMKSRQSPDLRADLRILLTSFGFNVLNMVRNKKLKNQIWFDLETVPLQDRESCPLPIYGSIANGNYRIICVWGRPPEDRIIDDIGKTELRSPAIVLYFGRMSTTRSRDLAHQCRERKRTFLVVDEKLVLYLCGERGSRLPVLFTLTFPFTFYEPYTITSGIVPPEMFYGRSSQKQSIMGQGGSSFIYGGRQLGKTVLLRSVEREFHNVDEGRLAIWIDLKAEGIGYERRRLEDLWRILSDHLMRIENADIIKQPIIDADKLFKVMNKWINEKSNRRILFLLDEADKFLEADGQQQQQGKQEFEYSQILKKWMEQTNRRIKVVFAGLHNVLRTTTQSNHPLAHYGEPICIGPLLNNGEWREARRLIETPIQSLGYTFEKDIDISTRILSQTNYYPSLLQIYCSKLLGHINERSVASDTTPPYVITSHQVEEAYYRADLRELIRDRFKLTLQLDQRYDIIANIIARESLRDESQGLVEGYSTSWIRKEARYWWAEGFKDNSKDDTFEVLLQEMEGLGVLRKTSYGNNYALRSPNVSLLMGTEAEISNNILREREAPSHYEPAKFRPKFGNHRSSPLTAQQEATLRNRKYGISIIFGSKISGLDDLITYLKSSFENEPFAIIENKQRQHDFSDELSQAINKFAKDDTPLVIVAHTCMWTEDWIEETYRQIMKLRDKKNYIRVVFIADPMQTRMLVSHESELFEMMQKDDKLVNRITLSPWHDVAVKNWLDNNDFLQEKRAHREALEAFTGNWSALLYQFYDEVKERRNNWYEHISVDIASHMQNKQNLEQVLDSFGLGQSDDYRRVLKMLSTWQSYAETEEDQITFDDIHGELDLPKSIVEKVLQWAELLHFVDSKRNDIGQTTYRIDSILANLLQYEGENE